MISGATSTFVEDTKSSFIAVFFYAKQMTDWVGSLKIINLSSERTIWAFEMNVWSVMTITDTTGVERFEE